MAASLQSPITHVAGKRRMRSEEEPFFTLERLPVRTLLYRCLPHPASAALAVEPAEPAPPLSSELLSLVLPLRPASTRVYEYMLARPVLVVRSAMLPSEEALAQHGADGWRSADGDTLCLLSPMTLLQLIDVDRQAGLSQSFITDLFVRQELLLQQARPHQLS
jgi:hypothetical protein